MSDHPPGFYAVTSWRGKNQWAFRTRRGDDIRWCVFDAEVGDTRGLEDGEVIDVRPLVVLDVAPMEGWSGLARNLCADNYHWLADQIEAQTRPPKPPEPTGLGAVVKDRKGDRWVRVDRFVPGCRWRKSDPCISGPREYDYDDIDAVEVLSEGAS